MKIIIIIIFNIIIIIIILMFTNNKQRLNHIVSTKCKFKLILMLDFKLSFATNMRCCFPIYWVYAARYSFVYMTKIVFFVQALRSKLAGEVSTLEGSLVCSGYIYESTDFAVYCLIMCCILFSCFGITWSSVL